MENHDQQSTLVNFDIYDETEFPSLWCVICFQRDFAPTVDSEGVEVVNGNDGVDESSRCKA